MGCFIGSALTAYGQVKDSLACEKDFSDLISLTYKVALRREVTGTFSVKQDDSIRYTVFRQKKHKATFTIVDSKGKTMPAKAIDAPVIAGRVEPVSAGNYFFRVKSRSLWSNTFIVTIQKKGCVYLEKKKIVPPPRDSTVYTTDTTISVRLDSNIYLAGKLNFKNKQRIAIPLDSLKGVVAYEIRSSGGPVKYSFINSGQKEVKRGEGEYSTGQLKGEQRGYSLLLENEDKVAGKHVHINVRQILYSRRILPK
jgi:hypothetical protein